MVSLLLFGGPRPTDRENVDVDLAQDQTHHFYKIQFSVLMGVAEIGIEDRHRYLPTVPFINYTPIEPCPYYDDDH